MDIINRVKNVLITPKTEWQTIEAENTPYMNVFIPFVVLLALIPAIAIFIGYGVIGYSVFGYHIASVSLGIRHAIIQYVAMVGGIYIAAFVINLLAESFGSRKNFDKAFSLVAYAYTPTFVAGIFYIYHSLVILASLAGIYSLYLLYIGLSPMMKTPAEKRTSYFIVSLLIMIVALFLLSFILTAILIGSAYKLQF